MRGRPSLSRRRRPRSSSCSSSPRRTPSPSRRWLRRTKSRATRRPRAVRAAQAAQPHRRRSRPRSRPIQPSAAAAAAGGTGAGGAAALPSAVQPETIAAPSGKLGSSAGNRLAAPRDSREDRVAKSEQLKAEGKSAYMTGRYRDAAKAYEKALQLNPDNGAAKTALAQLK